MSAHSVPGIVVAVVLEGEPAWSAGFGMADLENSAPATSSTLFRLGSISKPISAVAVLQLWERGKLDLDAPAQKYCPAFPQKEWPITSRELLGHLGGIRHYNSDGKGDIPEDSARHFSSMEESLQIFAADPLVAAEDGHRLADLVGRQRVERVLGRSPVNRHSWVVWHQGRVSPHASGRAIAPAPIGPARGQAAVKPDLKAGPGVGAASAGSTGVPANWLLMPSIQ